MTGAQQRLMNQLLRKERAKAEAARRIAQNEARRARHEAALEHRMVLEVTGCVGGGMFHPTHEPAWTSGLGMTACLACGAGMERVA